jgi:heme-degrading monooxygenase HmoA
MFARVTTVHMPPGTTTSTILGIHEQLLPALEKRKGFRKYTALVDRTTDKTMAIVYWDTEADMKASEQNGERSRDWIIAQLGAIESTIEEYEVAFHI